MYAVFQSGSKQYRVKEGQIVFIEKLDVKIGEIIYFNEVLMISNGEKMKIGNPFVKESLIKAKVIDINKGKKIRIVKFRRRKHYRKQQGHRQWFTKINIIDIK